MGFMEEYNKLKKKRKDETESKSSNNSFMNEYQKLKEENPTMEYSGRTSPAFPVAPTIDTITEKSDSEKEESKENKKWYQSGEFEDGYQFGDIAKTILGAVKKTSDEVSNDISPYIHEPSWVGNKVMAGVNAFNKSVTGTADVLLGKFLQELGWKDNPISSANNLYSNMYDSYNQKAEEIAKENGYGVGHEYLGEAIESTVAAVPNAILALMTAGSSLGATTGDLATKAAYEGGNLLTKSGLTIEGMMKDPQYWLSFAQTYGSDYEEAKSKGADDATAAIGSTISSLINAGIEIGFDGASGIQGLPEKVKQGDKNAILEWVKSSIEEGNEEVLQDFVSNIVSKTMYDKDTELANLEDMAKDWSMGATVGAVLGGGQMAVQGAINSTEKAIQAREDSKLTENEQKVIDKVVQDRIEEAQKKGDVNNKEKAKIRNEVVNELKKGYISTDTIEEVLGGETYKSYRETVDNEDALLKEYEELINLKKNDLTVKQDNRIKELEKQIFDFTNSDSRNKLKEQLGSEVSKMVAGDRLSESYNERIRRSQGFESDLTKYDSKQRKVIQNAIDSGILNNTNKTHEFVDLVAKISADKGVPFNFTNNAKLKESGFAIEGTTINGLVTNDGVALNIQSSKSLNSVVGHEITHVLEGTPLYDDLQKTIFEYAKSRKSKDSKFDSEYKERLYNTRNIYKNVNGYEGVEGFKKIKREVVADLVGDYLFTDEDFINSLSVNHRNIFQKIYDEIKYLYKVATAGSKEARELEKVKRAFDKAYREGGKAQAETKYSISDKNIKDIYNGYGYGETYYTMSYTQDGKIVATLEYGEYDGEPNVKMIEVDPEYRRKGIATKLMQELQKKYPDSEINFGMRTPDGAKLLDSITYDVTDESVVVERQKLKDLQTELNELQEKLDILYDTENLTEEQDAELHELGDRWQDVYESIHELSNNLRGKKATRTFVKMDTKYSLSDSDGNQLSEAQQEYFKDSKVRDENGNLKVMYHGTSNGGHTIFEPYGKAKYGLFGLGTYFTDNRSVAESYTQKGKGNNPQVYESYLNIKNPMDMDAAADPAEWAEAFPDAYFPKSGTNEDFYRAMEEYFEDEMLSKWEAAETAMEAIEGMGYDGITHIGGGRFNKADDTRHRVYIAFEPEQIKNIDNTSPTADPDIRYSLSDEARSYRGYSSKSPMSRSGYAMFVDDRNMAYDSESEGRSLYSVSHENLVDVKTLIPKIKDALHDAYENGTLPYELGYLEESQLDEFAELSNPDDIIMSAGFWDNEDAVDWLFNNTNIMDGIVGVKTEDGAIVFDESIIENETLKSQSDTRYSISDSNGNQLSEAQQEYFKNSKVRDENGNLKIVYHGSGSEFNEFSYDFMSSHGSSEGQGFYFTDSENMAKGYQQNGTKLMKGYLDINKPLSDSEVTIKRNELTKLLKYIDPTGDDIIINYDPSGGMGYPSKAWYNRALAGTVNSMLQHNSSDSEILADIANSGAGTEAVPTNVRKLLGYDGYIVSGKYNDATVYVAFESNQFKNIDNLNPTADPDIRYSLSEEHNDLDGFAKEYLDTKSIQYSLSATPTHRKSLEKNYSIENASLELPVIMKRYDKILDIWTRLSGELDSKFLNDWNNKVERPFTIFKAQTGYKYNVELSSMCKKGVPLFEAIDTIVKKEVMKELGTDVLGQEEKEILYDILKQHHFEIPCAICYVEQARQREGAIIDAFLNGKTDTNASGEVTGHKLGWNQVLDSIQKEMKANGVDHNFAYVSRDIATDKYIPADLTMDEQTYTAFAEAVKKIANEEITRYNKESGKKRKLLKDVTPEAVKECFKGTLPANLKIFKVLLTEPSSRFKIQNDLLYSYMTTQNLTMAHNGLYSLFNSQGGVSGYKTKQAPTVYWGEILNKHWKPEDTRKEGGVRNQSNSDSQMYTLLDQAQMYMDFSAKGYYLQAYTKVLSELKLFGLSRSKINASLIPRVVVYRNADGSVDVERTMENAGLDENGNPAFDDIEGINHTEAFMLLEDAEYSKNIGGVCIGYSDKHIWKLLDDDRVQLIIGFHDKTNDPDKRYRGARYAKNYNGLNEAVDLKNGKTVHIGFNPFVNKAENKFKYNKATESFEGTINYNGKTYTADDIPDWLRICLEYCAKKGYDPAYKDFSGHRNYYKLLADFSLYDSQGHYAPHLKVAYNMPDSVPYLDADGNKKYMETEEYIKIELQKELAVRDAIAEAMADTSEDGIIPQFMAEVKRRKGVAPTMSLSEIGEEPTKYGNYNVYGKDIALEEAPIRRTAPVQKTVAETKTTRNILPDDYAPMTDDESAALQMDRLNSLSDSDVPPEMEAPYSEEASSYVKPEDPFAGRNIDAVGNRKVKAYMYENPEVKPFFQAEAQNMLSDLHNSIKGERWYNDELYYSSNGEKGWGGTKRHTTDDIAFLLDNYHYTYEQIEKGLNAIIEDNGAENNAVSKRIEFMLDDRLRNGYTAMFGEEIPADQDYINFLNEKQITEYSKEAFDKFMETADDYAPPVSEEDIAPVATSEENTVTENASPMEPQSTAAENVAPIKTKGEGTQEDNVGKQRSWVETSTESEPVNREILPDDLNQSAIYYQPISNKKTLNNANARLESMGYEASVSYFNSQFANQKVSLDDIALGERLIQEAVKAKDYKTAGELIQNVAILGTELGQKVQALSIIQRLTPAGQLKMIQKTVERGKTKGDKSFADVEVTQEMTDEILKTYNDDGSYNQADLDKAVEDVKQKIADQMAVTKMEKVDAWRYLSMLGNPKTHIRNIVSNIAMKGTAAVKNAIARTVEDIAPIKDRTRTWKQPTDDVKEFAKTTTSEMKDVITGGSKYSETSSIKAKRDVFKNKILNKVYEFNSELLENEDWAFSKSAFKNAFQEYLTANGIKTKADIEGNREIVEKAKVYATEQAQIETFRQYSWLANKINEIERKNTATDIVVGSILPFKKTPINIAKAGLNYSPLGFAKTLTYDISQVKKGNMNASTLVDHLAQNITGTGLTLVGYMLASMGILNGSGDDDKEGTYDYQLGKQSYSVTIGDSTFSLSWLSPAAMPLFVGANAYEQLVEGNDWNGDVVIQTLAQTLDPLSEMSFLSSLDSVLSSYDSGIQKFAGIGETMVQNYVTQFVPTLSSQLAATIDDTKRSTKVAGDSGFKAFDETINKLIYKIPFLRETLEPSTDIWGNEVKQSENVITRALENFIAPYSKRDSIASAVDKEIKTLYAETGDNGIIPSVPYNYINYDNEKYKMSANEYTKFKKTYGQTASSLMESLFNTTTYKNATSEEKAEMVNRVYDYASDQAKREYLAKEGVDYTNATKDGVEYYKENSIKGAIENDMTVDEYDFATQNPERYDFLNASGISYAEFNASEETRDAYNWAYKNPDKYTLSKAIANDVMQYRKYTSELYDIKADKDSNGKTISGSRKEKVINYIDNLDADYGEKIILFKSEYPSDDTYNYEIIDYLNSREDISYDEMETILKELGFTVLSDGSVRW